MKHSERSVASFLKSIKIPVIRLYYYLTDTESEDRNHGNMCHLLQKSFLNVTFYRSLYDSIIQLIDIRYIVMRTLLQLPTNICLFKVS